MKKKTFYVGNQFPVIVEEGADGGYVVTCPVFEGCYSQGETIEEALKNIKEAILLCLEEVEEMRQKPFLPKVGLHFVEVQR